MPKSKVRGFSVKPAAGSLQQAADYYIAAIFTFYILNFTGCATAPLVSPPSPTGIPGIYHCVEKGQTLWRISKIYNVDLEELVRVNRIPDASSIELGRLIFIPHRQKQQTPPYKSTLFEDFIWPARGKVIASFGQNFNNMLNKGINIQTSGASDVVASRSGKVIFYTANLKGFGKTIIIDHGDGFSTVYTRNSQVFVKVGDNVQQKTVIAKIDSSGNRDKNAYLHFQIRKGHLAQNPYFYLPR